MRPAIGLAMELTTMAMTRTPIANLTFALRIALGIALRGALGIALRPALSVALGLALSMTPSGAGADERLSLAEATSRALARNHSIRVEREQVTAADARARGSLGAYDVQLSVDVNARHHRDPVNSLFS